MDRSFSPATPPFQAYNGSQRASSSLPSAHSASSTSSILSSPHYVSAAQAGPSTPSPARDTQVSVKDCPHRGDLLGYRPEAPVGTPDVEDPPSPPPLVPPSLIRVGSISAMLREMRQDIPDRPLFTGPGSSPRQIAPLPVRREDPRRHIEVGRYSERLPTPGSSGTATIPHPRPARQLEREEDHDRIDFSPRRLGRRTQPEWATDSFRPFPRIRPGQLSHDQAPESTHSGEESERMRRWNRDMQEAIGRRVGETPSPGAAARRHEEITAQAPYLQPMIPTRWGDVTGRHRLRSYHLERFLGVLDTMDADDADEEFYADINWDQAEQMFDTPHSLPHSHRQPVGPSEITPDMNWDDRVRLAGSIATGVGRWPGHCRKSAAAGTLKKLLWKDVVGTEEMAKDTYCSVCHDEYEDDVEIAVTPCKHMYHHGCLETWLETPNTSSCPMCRRDLAVLVGISKMVPSRTTAEALPLWMGL